MSKTNPHTSQHNADEHTEESSCEQDNVQHQETSAPSLEEVQKLKQEVAEKNHKYLMALADAENARKRMAKERVEYMQYAVENTISDFLNPMENMEKALVHAKNMSDEVKNWAIGFEMILQQFKNVLSEKGITEYVSVGTKFDPFAHEAVEIEYTDEFPEDTVLEEFSKGYKTKDRTIRVARVKVAKPVSAKPATESQSAPEKAEDE